MDRDDPGVAEGGKRTGLVANQARMLAMEDLDRDATLELRIAGLVHRAHPAAPDLANDLIPPDPLHDSILPREPRAG